MGKTQVPYPATSIGFLQLIPPVGTKFGAASTMGPASQQPVAEGIIRRRCRCILGSLRGSDDDVKHEVAKSTKDHEEIFLIGSWT